MTQSRAASLPNLQMMWMVRERMTAMGAVLVQSITVLILGKTGPDFKQSTNGRE